jgi:hypothetical protein
MVRVWASSVGATSRERTKAQMVGRIGVRASRLEEMAADNSA